MMIVDWDARASDSAVLHQMAQLNLIAYPRFYSSLGIEPERLPALSERLLLVDGGEIWRGRIALDDGVVSGFTTFLAESAFAAAVARTAFEIIKFVDKASREAVSARMRETADDLPKLAGEALYLSRIAVAPGARGRGLGRQLLEDFHQHAEDGVTSLHVDTDNAAAIQLYQQSGYHVVAQSTSEFYMRRPSQGTTS